MEEPATCRSGWRCSRVLLAKDAHIRQAMEGMCVVAAVFVQGFIEWTFAGMCRVEVAWVLGFPIELAMYGLGEVVDVLVLGGYNKVAMLNEMDLIVKGGFVLGCFIELAMDSMCGVISIVRGTFIVVGLELLPEGPSTSWACWPFCRFGTFSMGRRVPSATGSMGWRSPWSQWLGASSWRWT